MVFAGFAITITYLAWIFFEKIFSNFLGYYEGSALYILSFILSGITGFALTYLFLEYIPKKIRDDKEEAFKKGYEKGKKD